MQKRMFYNQHTERHCICESKLLMHNFTQAIQVLIKDDPCLVGNDRTLFLFTKGTEIYCMRVKKPPMYDLLFV